MYLKPEFETYFLSRQHCTENRHIQHILGEFNTDKSENYCSNLLKIVSILKIKQQKSPGSLCLGRWVCIYLYTQTSIRNIAFQIYMEKS